MVEFTVDNMAVVYSKHQHLMHLIHTFVFLASHFKFWFSPSHTEGKAYILADALSCNNLQLSFLQARDLKHFILPHIPPQLLTIISDSSLARIYPQIGSYVL